jgi:CMP-N-acetylneuraminic acid synthetase
MKVVVLIPARGGSKGVPRKNLGFPLTCRVLFSCQCSVANEVWVSTESQYVKSLCRRFSSINVWDRPKEFARDESSSESVLIDFAESNEFDVIALVQCTSPLMRTEDLNRGIEAVKSGGYDSAFSVTTIRQFIWKGHGDRVWPVNYEAFKVDGRPRRQEMRSDQIYRIETGAFYVTTKKQLMETKLRISGHIKAVEVPFWTSFEVDNIDDVHHIERLL